MYNKTSIYIANAKMDNKYLYGLIIIVIIIIAFYYLKYKKVEKINTKKDKKKGKSGKKKNKKQKREKEESQMSINNDGSVSDEDVEDKAKELYELIHDDMAKGMTLEEFQKKVDEDLADELKFLEIKQLYNTSDPDEITEEDYEKILSSQ